MKTINLITCNDLYEAHIIKARLNNERIPCFLTNQNFTNLMPHYSNLLGSGIQIMVRDSDYKIARELIIDKIKPENEGIICPYCGSEDIGLGVGRNPLFKLINILIAILAMIPIGHLKPKYYCKICYKEIK